MKKSIEELERELKKKTGEDKLPMGDLVKTKNTFNSTKFVKLARAVRKILLDDEQYTNFTLKTQ